MERPIRFALIAALFAATGARAQTPDGGHPPPADDEIIIIEDDEPFAPPTGPPRPPLPNLPRPPTPPGFPDPSDIPVPPPLPLGELTLAVSPAEVTEVPHRGGRSFMGLRPEHITLTGHLGLRTSLRPLGTPFDDVGRGLADGIAVVDVRPDLPLSAHVEVLARARGAVGARLPSTRQLDLWDLVLPHRKTEPGARASGILEIGEAYVQARLERFKVTLGRQVFSWTQSLSSPLPSLLNPPDPRDGVALPDDVTARSPVFAAAVQGNVGPLGVQAVLVPMVVPPRVPLYAEDAEAVDPHEPVLSLISSRASLRRPEVARGLQANVPSADALQLGEFSPSVGTRTFFTAGPADVALMAVVGTDPTPLLETSDRVARALGAAADRPSTTTVSLPLYDACKSDACPELGGELRMRWRHALTLQAEASGVVGVAVVRAVAHLSPLLAPVIGRVAHVVDSNGRLVSTDVWTGGGSLTIETGYAEFVQGFVEAGYDVVGDVPAGARLARYEPVDQARAWERTAHRPTLSVRLQGIVFDDISWRLRATVAPWQRELFASPRIGYRLSLNQEVVMGTELFVGWPGTRAWFLLPTSRAYLEWDYRF